ncbi:hypothetical protein [Kribbella sp. NBC_00359]|uniref:hypothetical protein n=1 Tax=Kribbella sp. NBC_00359 TaxID=2975966 RepID=UPI002E1D4F4B
MRRRIVIAGLVVAVLLAIWLIDNRQGAALDVGDGSMTIGSPLVGKADFYFLAPALESRSTIELVGMTPEIAEPGLEFVDARIYRREDFLGGVPASWTTSNGDSSNPTKLASAPLAGYKLTGEQRKEDVVLLHLRVTTDQRPLNVTAVRVTYRNGFREHTQAIDAKYQVIAPRRAG